MNKSQDLCHGRIKSYVMGEKGDREMIEMKEIGMSVDCLPICASPSPKSVRIATSGALSSA